MSDKKYQNPPPKIMQKGEITPPPVTRPKQNNPKTK